MADNRKTQKSMTLVRRMETPGWMKLAVPAVSIVGGLLFSAIFLLAAGESPIQVYSVMLGGAFGSLYGLGETIVKMIPLMILSVGISFAFKMQIWNAGGEGQLHIGAAAATYVVLHLQGYDRKTTLTAAFLAAFVCAGIYGLIPAVLKVKWKVNELITCLMLNYVGTLLISWLIQGPWKDPSGFAFPRTEKFRYTGEMPTFFGTRIHAGVVIGLVLALVLWFVLAKTKWGFEIKLIGTNPKVAEYAGIPVKRYILTVMFISAGIAGVAGMFEVCGITHRLQANFAAQVGPSGMTIAYLAQCHPLGAVLVSFLFGALLVGGNTIQKLGLPVSTVQMIQGSILFFVAAGTMFTNYRIVWKER